MNKDMKRVLELTEKYANDMEKIVIEMAAENEVLRAAVTQTLQYYDVHKFNKVFHKKWDRVQCKEIGKALHSYCRARAIKVRKREINDGMFCSVNSYPLTAWNDFLEDSKPLDCEVA